MYSGRLESAPLRGQSEEDEAESHDNFVARHMQKEKLSVLVHAAKLDGWEQPACASPVPQVAEYAAIPPL